jgi:short-subunit dehydrogenase
MMNWLRLLALGGVAGASGYWLLRYLQPEDSPMVLNGSVVVITGASSGIGRALADAFARHGAKVVLAARRADVLETARKQIEPYATEVLAIPTDITDETNLRALVDQTLARFGRIDVLVNNAGAGVSGPLHTLNADDIRQGVRTNYEAAMLLTQIVLPTMLAQRSGKIVNIASLDGRVAVPAASIYGSSKHGLLAFSDALRRELFGTGVHVTSVLPSWTRTDMIPPDVQTALPHIDTPEFVAAQTIDGMLRNLDNVYFGGFTERLELWCERHFPRLMNLYYRMQMTPQYLDSSQSRK